MERIQDVFIFKLGGPQSIPLNCKYLITEIHSRYREMSTIYFEI